MSWIVVTPPAEALVSVATVKNVLNVDHTLDDTLIAGLVSSATTEAERISRRSLVTRTLRLALERWPLDGVILLDMPPVQSITSVQYYDADSVLQTVPSADYVGVLDVSRPYVCPAAGKSWPTDLRDHSAVRVTYVAGYGTAAQVLAAVPEIVRIVQWQAAVDYENRESMTTNALAAKKRMEDKLESYCGWETP